MTVLTDSQVVAEAGTVHYLSLDEIRDALKTIGYAGA